MTLFNTIESRGKAEAYAAALTVFFGIRPTMLYRDGVYNFIYTAADKQKIVSVLRKQLRPYRKEAETIKLNLEPIIAEAGLKEFGLPLLLGLGFIYLLGKVT
jgi:hypothetical protein